MSRSYDNDSTNKKVNLSIYVPLELSRNCRWPRMEYIQLGVEAMYDCQRDKVMIGELVASCFYYDVFFCDTTFPFVELSLFKNDSIS